MRPPLRGEWRNSESQSRRTVCPAANAARSSRAVFPSSGWRASGAISTSGSRTKRRWCMCRMRNLQARLIHDAIPKQHHVDINVARTFLAHAETSHRRFDLQRKLEQFSRRLVGFNRRHAVQKPGLVRNVDRLGLIQCGDGQQPSRDVQLCDRRAQVGRTISQVRSQRQISGFAHPTSFAAKGARIQQKLTGAGIIHVSMRWRKRRRKSSRRLDLHAVTEARLSPVPRSLS